MSEQAASATGRTFEDDCVRIEGRFYSCRELGLDWPPPETLHVYVESPGIAVVSPLDHPSATEYRQVTRSRITDGERAGMTHVFRAAEYEAVGRSSFHEAIAEDLAPLIGELRCDECSRSALPSVAEIATYLEEGWPTCHGFTMRLVGRERGKMGA